MMIKTIHTYPNTNTQKKITGIENLYGRLRESLKEETRNEIL